MNSHRGHLKSINQPPWAFQSSGTQTARLFFTKVAVGGSVVKRVSKRSRLMPCTKSIQEVILSTCFLFLFTKFSYTVNISFLVFGIYNIGGSISNIVCNKKQLWNFIEISEESNPILSFPSCPGDNRQTGAQYFNISLNWQIYKALLKMVNIEGYGLITFYARLSMFDYEREEEWMREKNLHYRCFQNMPLRKKVSDIFANICKF